MNTIGNLANQIVMQIKIPESFVSQDYSKTPYTFSEAPSIEVLRSLTTGTIEADVNSYVRGNQSFESIKSNIIKETIPQYLAAAKLIDTLYPQNELKKTTFKIRFECLLKDKEINNGTNQTSINIINVFALPPANCIDPLFLNGINTRHPDLAKMNFEESADIRSKVYKYSKYDLSIHPEAFAKIKEIMESYYISLEKVDSELPKNTTTIFRGCPGAGKTFKLSQFHVNSGKIMDLTKSVFSTDRVMEHCIREFDSTADQAFLLGLSISQALNAEIKKNKPELPFIQEGWFKNESEINSLFVPNRGLDLNDFDGDLRLIELRILQRVGKEKLSSTLGLDVIERSFLEHRKTRQLLIDKLRENDTYRLQFSHNDGNIDYMDKDMARNNIVFDVDEAENSKKSTITEQDVLQVGESLRPFVGKTIEEAFAISSKK